MTIRAARESDLPALTAIEAACFPASEAATEQSIAERLRAYPDHFWVLEEDGEIIAFLNGMATDRRDLSDEMYEDAGLHDERGDWQMIFGVDTLPEHRRKGLAGKLLRHAIDDARTAGRKGLVLTCKDHLVHWYAAYGFRDEGISGSTHGNVAWHQMRLTF